jgi:hypothetical protein
MELFTKQNIAAEIEWRMDSNSFDELGLELSSLKTKIDSWLEKYNLKSLQKLSYQNRTVYSDIIWAEK